MPGAGRSRAAALAVAVAAGLLLLATELPDDSPTGPLLLSEAWPEAVVAQLSGQLDDGAAYQPMIFLDPLTSIGTAAGPGRGEVRLLRRDPSGVTTLRSLPAEVNPLFGGFARQDGELVWAESTVTEGRAGTELWAVRDGEPPRLVTADTGEVVFFNSRFDLVLADGRVHWASAGADDQTLIRSVSLTGDEPHSRPIPGHWALTDWPWLVAAGGQPRLRHLTDGVEIAVEVAPGELVSCAPVWCRALLPPGGEQDPGIALLRPDGTDRRQVVTGGSAMAALVDVALADRFEPYLLADAQRLLLYDLTADRSVQLASGAGQVLAAGGFLWWSTGLHETLTWHVLDLGSIPSA